MDHPNLVRVYDAVDQPQAVLIMELVDGQSLADRLTTGPLTEDQAHRLATALADCLAYLHQCGVVHRDVKPANILLGDDGRPRLADFGIARLVDATRLTQAGQTIGTLAYMAPEQLTGQTVGPPADIYALGLVMLEALSGRRAFPGSHEEVVAARLARDPHMPPEIGGFWRSLLADMTTRQPERRPTARDIEHRLRGGSGPEATEVMPGNAAANASTVALPAAAPPNAGARMPRRRMLAGLAGVIGVLLLAVVVIALASQNHQSASPPASVTTTSPPTTPATQGSSTSSTSSTSTASAASAVSSAVRADAALIREIASGESRGTVDPGTGQAVSQLSQQAITDEALGKSAEAANDLQQAAMAIANGIQSGKVDQTEGATLQADLATLADALGLSTVSTPPTAPAAPGKHKPTPGKGP